MTSAFTNVKNLQYVRLIDITRVINDYGFTLFRDILLQLAFNLFRKTDFFVECFVRRISVLLFPKIKMHVKNRIERYTLPTVPIIFLLQII